MVITSGCFGCGRCLWCFDRWWCLRWCLLFALRARLVSGDDSDSSFRRLERVSGPTDCSTLTPSRNVSLSLTEGNRSDTCSYEPTSRSWPNSVWLRRHTSVSGTSLEELGRAGSTAGIGLRFFGGGESRSLAAWLLSELSEELRLERYSCTRASPKLKTLASPDLEAGAVCLPEAEPGWLVWDEGVCNEEWPTTQHRMSMPAGYSSCINKPLFSTITVVKLIG